MPDQEWVASATVVPPRGFTADGFDLPDRRSVRIWTDPTGLLTIEWGLTAPTGLRATRMATTDIHQAFSGAGEVIGLKVTTAKTEPTSIALMGNKEIAIELGVSKQRVSQLMAQHPDFPHPVARLRMGPIFTAASIRAFKARWPRPNRAKSFSLED